MNVMIDYILLAAHVFVLCFHIIDMIVSHKKLSVICDKCGASVTVSPLNLAVDGSKCVLDETQLKLLVDFVKSLKGDFNG